MKRLVAVLLVTACFAQAETIDVPCGQMRSVEAGRRFTDGVLVKTGGGVLDLTGAVLGNAGLEIREGSVRMSAGVAHTATGRFIKFTVTKTRPASAADHGGSGPQYSEFHIFKDGKPVPFPAGTKAIDGPVGTVEGPEKAIDGNVNTKYYNPQGVPLVLDLGCTVSFDAYSYATANDAIGRDPADWVVSVGEMKNGSIAWQSVGSISNYSAPKKRLAEIGTTFPVALRDVVPCDYPVTVCGKGRMVLVGVNETLEKASGCGLIVLEDSSVAFASGTAFTGSVSGGNVTYR